MFKFNKAQVKRLSSLYLLLSQNICQNYSKTERPLAAEAGKDPIDVHEKQTLRQLIQLWFDFFIKADCFLHRFTSE